MITYSDCNFLWCSHIMYKFLYPSIRVRASVLYRLGLRVNASFVLFYGLVLFYELQVSSVMVKGHPHLN